MANIIKQFKDSDGNNVYPLAYAQGGMKMDLLWTNPNPSSNFTAQTLTLDMSDYTMIAILFNYEVPGNNNLSSLQFAVVGQGKTLFQMGSQIDANNIRRFGTINTNDIVFDDGGYSGTTSNAHARPYKIYGIKMSYIVPTQVHGLQYIEV